MYESGIIYEHFVQKKDEFDSLLSSADDELKTLKSKDYAVLILLNSYPFLHILFGRKYKKLDECLIRAEMPYEELVHKQVFMKPILQATDPTPKNVLETHKMFEVWCQDARDFVNYLYDIEGRFDRLNAIIQKKSNKLEHFETGVYSFFHWFKSNRVQKWCIRFFLLLNQLYRLFYFSDLFFLKQSIY